MLKLFDTHAHYNDEAFNEDREEIIKKVYESGVEKTVVVGYDLEHSKMAVEIAKSHDFLYAAVGIHPSDIAPNKNEINKQVKEIEKIAQNEKVVAIGEIGLDYHWETDTKDLQKYAFLEFIKLANKLNLPIIIHSRDAIMDTIEVIKGDILPNKKGILHCCQLNKDLVKAGLEAGFYISFAGAITFKNSKNAPEIIQMVPDDRLLVETDSPYLSPEPYRGQRNDSSNVKFVAEKVAEIKGKSLEEIAKITYENARRIYNI